MRQGGAGDCGQEGLGGGRGCVHGYNSGSENVRMSVLACEVSVFGSQNVRSCGGRRQHQRALVDGTWHTMEGPALRGLIDETCGYHSNSEHRAGPCALLKVVQEGMRDTITTRR